MKGDRYAAGLPAELVDKIRHRLPGYSWKRAKLFYDAICPELSDAGQRFLAACDRFYLLAVVLNRKDLDNEWLYDRCREVELDTDGYLDLWARYHYKSTIITFGGIIQEIINDPEITIAVFSNTKETARPFLRQIKEELEKNKELPRLYPDIFYDDPKKQAPVWSADLGIVVKRQANPKELTVSAFGLLDGLPTGGHWQLLVFDDIVTNKSVTQTNTDQIGRTTLAWEQAQNLGTHAGTRRWHLGTRYHFADTYGILIERQSLKPRIYPATHDGSLRGKPVFLSPERWDEIKRDQRLTVAAQQLLNPLAGEENTFLVDWLRHYELRPMNLTVWILVDGAGNKLGAKTDRTAIMVLGMDPNSNFYLLDGYCHRMKLSERTDRYLELNEKWRTAPGVQTVFTGYERYGAMTDVEHIEIEARRRQQEGVNIEEVNWVREGAQSKRARIGRLEPDFRNSRFWLPKYVHVNRVGKCTWSIHVKIEARLGEDGKPQVDKVSRKPIMDTIDGSAEIIYAPYRGPTKLEDDAKLNGELYRIQEPLRRRDADGNVYDLTRVVFEEYRLHPFGAHEDALDAMSRVKDMDPVPPLNVESQPAERDSVWTPD